MIRSAISVITPADTMLLPTPQMLHSALPLSSKIKEEISSFRKSIGSILVGKEQKVAIVVGPCSLHDPSSALYYAKELKHLSQQIQNTCFVVMRAYLEKPRTKIGWKGYLYDPFLDGSNDIISGLRLSRELLIELASLGIPLATEFLDPLSAPYYEDLISWGFVGARTSSSSIHRQMASAMPMPIGFKNSTEGSIESAIHGIISAKEPHSFISCDKEGRLIARQSDGNPHTHLVLRGATSFPNYQKEHVAHAVEELKKASIQSKILIDCSHGNSGKMHTRQPEVFLNVMQQIEKGNNHIAGVMLESFIEEGNQSLSEDVSSIKASVSITDPCISFCLTEKLLLSAGSMLTSCISS